MFTDQEIWDILKILAALLHMEVEQTQLAMGKCEGQQTLPGHHPWC